MRRIRHLPVLYWATALLIALVTGATVARLVGAAGAEARRWGDLATVPVTLVALGPGEVLAADDVALRQVPRSILPEGEVAAEPAGRTALVPVAAGEILLDAKLALPGRSGAAALVPEGRKGLAIPRGDAVPPLEVGDLVDVLATLNVDGDVEGAAGEPTFAVAVAAPVVAVSRDQVTVAVSEDEAPRVAYALVQGAVTLAVTAGP